MDTGIMHTARGCGHVASMHPDTGSTASRVRAKVVESLAVFPTQRQILKPRLVDCDDAVKL